MSIRLTDTTSRISTKAVLPYSNARMTSHSTMPMPPAPTMPTTEAETLAQLGGVAQAFEHALPEDAASLDMHADTASLAEAIVGSWKSPFGDLTFRDDGTVSAHMGDGANFTGNWSVDAAGHLHADVMGTAMDAEAAFAEALAQVRKRLI